MAKKPSLDARSNLARPRAGGFSSDASLRHTDQAPLFAAINAEQELALYRELFSMPTRLEVIQLMCRR